MVWVSLGRIIDAQGLSAEERRHVLEDLFVFGRGKRRAFLFRMATLLFLSTVIATAGLLADSAAVVIGAMLVAPMMTPVMAAAAAIVMGWPRRLYEALTLLLGMAVGALLLSVLITLFSPEVIIIPEQVLARTRPTYYDLLIALAAGAAGAYTITRRQSNAIPGVAVAVALLPPLASAGILITTKNPGLALAAVLLFLTNFIAMVLAGVLAFLAVGVSPKKSRRQSSNFIRTQLALFALLTLAVAVPLWYFSDKVLFNPQYRALKSDALQEWLKEQQLEMTDVDIIDEPSTLILALQGPHPPLGIADLHSRLIEELDDEEFSIDYTWTQKIQARWPLRIIPIDQIADYERNEKVRLAAVSWRWYGTQYSADIALGPQPGERMLLRFDPEGKFELEASCASLDGTYFFNGQTLRVRHSSEIPATCAEDDLFQLLASDLALVRQAAIDDQFLVLRIPAGEGTLYFEPAE